MELTRKILLCADDYGLSAAVSRGIRELLENERLSATSCMVVFPEFADDGPLLSPFLEKVDIGLHFTLTTRKSLRSILIAGWSRQLHRDHMRRELDRQLALFISALGRPPAYIDGHQHVHLLPGVREAVIEAAAGIGAYVRITREPITSTMRKRPAPLDCAYLTWASRSLEKLAIKHGIRTNTGFRGVRSFRERAPFRDLFRTMIAEAANGTIIMCHPGHVDEALLARDPIHRQREEEFAYFASEDFLRDLSTAHLKLATLADCTVERKGSGRS